ncbi:bacteriocin-like protein [Chryseobacterium oryctis]|uniref:Bacteriocin-type signal sequence-containing protein n=1 Tax=Chryseobacterium oryctis TaxID=2952618 RepID=A0ABT3HS95_9FLAO|nr:hypothetical protein [Chryseobacterium oryctis]MCW3162656.1 hypothetical protein [Chryseobacterium oryctis]
MKNLKKISRERLKKVSGGIRPQCCTFYPPELQIQCCPNPSSMSCPPPWVEGSFPLAC